MPVFFHHKGYSTPVRPSLTNVEIWYIFFKFQLGGNISLINKEMLIKMMKLNSFTKYFIQISYSSEALVLFG